MTISSVETTGSLLSCANAAVQATQLAAKTNHLDIKPPIRLINPRLNQVTNGWLPTPTPTTMRRRGPLGCGFAKLILLAPYPKERSVLRGPLGSLAFQARVVARSERETLQFCFASLEPFVATRSSLGLIVFLDTGVRLRKFPIFLQEFPIEPQQFTDL